MLKILIISTNISYNRIGSVTVFIGRSFALGPAHLNLPLGIPPMKNNLSQPLGLMYLDLQYYLSFCFNRISESCSKYIHFVRFSSIPPERALINRRIT